MLWKQDFKIKPTFNCSIDGIDGIDGSALPSMLHQTLENVLMIAENVSCSIIGLIPDYVFYQQQWTWSGQQLTKPSLLCLERLWYVLIVILANNFHFSFSKTCLMQSSQVLLHQTHQVWGAVTLKQKAMCPKLLYCIVANVLVSWSIKIFLQ